MLNNNHKNSACQYAESLVSYLYDEINAKEKTQFEAHLKNCAACDAELKEFGFARTAIQDWRVAAFDQLPTPAFEIPAQTIHSIKNDEKSFTWFDNLKRIFSFKPALAMSALVVLVALFSIAAFVLNFKTDEPLAENINDRELTQATASPTVAKKVVEPKKVVEEKENEKPTASVVNSPLKNDEPKTVNAKAVPVKASAPASKNNEVKIAPIDVKRNQKPNVAPKTDVPQVVEAEEEEDDSIRLADLFDEIGTE